MIRISIDLPEETEAVLRAESERRGLSPEVLASQTLTERFPQPKYVNLPAAEWTKRFREFVESLPERQANFDDSRESIYDDGDESR